MALFRRFFYRKPPDGLLEISERVYVFDCCFSTDAIDEDEYRTYMKGIVSQLQDHQPDAAFMVFNFQEGERRSQLSEVLSQYDMMVMDYPRQYEACPLLPLEMIHHFLRLCDSRLSYKSQQYILLMHCERGGWPLLAFMVAGLLLYMKQYIGEQRTLEMVYKQAPRELLHLFSALNPKPSQLRYLEYITRRKFGLDWPPSDTPLALDCIILRILPLYDGGRGCRPVVRVYGQDSSSKTSSRSSKLLYSSSKVKKHIRLYRQEECELVKIDVHCRVQGDVVLECTHMEDDLVREEMIFRVMFHTTFVRSNILMLNRDEADVLWDAKDQISRDFRAEVLFSDADSVSSIITTNAVSEYCVTNSASPEEFFEAEEIFNSVVDGQDGKGEPHSHTVQASAQDVETQDGTGKNVVVGFDRDLIEIKTLLAYDSPTLKVVPIVGMGGIGKTTLARHVFDDSYVVNHFDICAWVTVSQKYSLRQVLLGLLDSAQIPIENMSKSSEAELVEYLYKGLIGRRYLMVMDDMWDTKIWDSVNIAFPEDSRGSCVLLTTRLSGVAFYANSCRPLHRMGFLSQDDSWNLLCNKVFGEGKDCPHEFEEIGKEIARNCEGLPIAIVVISGLLSKMSRTIEYWRSVADNLSSIVTKDDEQCAEILSLSYNHLPNFLRPCFLYMGAFPEDHEIPVSKLIRLWIAEGFLEQHESKSLEELAEEYLKDLIARNLIMVRKQNSTGKIKTCNIHDLLRNLCILKAHKENFLYVVKGNNDDALQENTVPRLSIHPDALSISEIHNSSVHSLVCTGVHLIYPPRVYLGYTLLRVLDLLIVHFSQFPAEIIKLVYLKYLAFTYDDALPSSIAGLQNLETIVHHSRASGKYPFLPVEIWTMPKLRHIYVTPSYLRDALDAQILVNNSFLLENLQTLLDVRNLRCGSDILKRIPNVKELAISYDVSSSAVWSEYHLETLVNLLKLEKLKLLIKNLSRKPEIVHQSQLAFPQNLKRLTLIGCAIAWECMTIVGSLPNLQVLKLKRNACRGTKWEPVEDEFSQLRYLLLAELDLVEWIAEDTHFPLLQRLTIRSCFKLKEIPFGFGEIPTLEMIELVDCYDSAVSSAQEIEKEQHNIGNKDLKVVVGTARSLDNKLFSCVLH
ncbi:hypothetical protein BUALT_Bualt07G0067000 [Buddleja alternifolia]|uniref:C2 tensin-type domain-containing protein n=1 Tax=Buddleja alternifolia TaxID=168488 RepID=A0AAV6XFF5_9LAMI|nr:hypothetical protein BUALT_Bualt07G0067000 [Buddleja alternifolia]